MRSIAQPTEENHKVHYIRKSCTMLALQRRFTIFQVCLVVFLGPLRCKSGSANNLNIMFHVCSLPVISESPFNLNCTKNASKFANRNQKTLFEKLFQGYWRFHWRSPALLKNRSGQPPGPSNLPRSWKRIQKHIKTECLPSFFGGK